MDIADLSLTGMDYHGVNLTSDGRTPDGVMVYVKRHVYDDNPIIDVTAEIAGAKFAQQLGLKAADFLAAQFIEDCEEPETDEGYEREPYGAWHTVQTALPGEHLGSYAWDNRKLMSEGLLLADDARGFWLLDNLLCNGDRHSGNFLWNPADSRTMPIDHGFARCTDSAYGDEGVFARGAIWQMPLADQAWRNYSIMGDMLLDIDIDAAWNSVARLTHGEVSEFYFECVARRQEFLLDWLIERGA